MTNQHAVCAAFGTEYEQLSWYFVGTGVYRATSTYISSISGELSSPKRNLASQAYRLGHV